MFLVVNADNLTDFDLRVLIDAHRAAGTVATLSVFHAPRPSECGIVAGRRRADGRLRGEASRPPRATSPTPACTPSARPCSTTSRNPCPGTSVSTCSLASSTGRPSSIVGDSYFLDIGTPAALELARDRLGRQDLGMIITQTPLRVGLVGGGTDLPDYYREHGGRVLNAAIDKYVYVVVKQRFDDDDLRQLLDQGDRLPGRGPPARTRPRSPAHDGNPRWRRDHDARRHSLRGLRSRLLVRGDRRTAACVSSPTRVGR